MANTARGLTGRLVLPHAEEEHRHDHVLAINLVRKMAEKTAKEHLLSRKNATSYHAQVLNHPL